MEWLTLVPHIPFITVMLGTPPVLFFSLVMFVQRILVMKASGAEWGLFPSRKSVLGAGGWGLLGGYSIGMAPVATYEFVPFSSDLSVGLVATAMVLLTVGLAWWQLSQPQRAPDSSRGPADSFDPFARALGFGIGVIYGASLGMASIVVFVDETGQSGVGVAFLAIGVGFVSFIVLSVMSHWFFWRWVKQAGGAGEGQTVRGG